MWLHNFHVDPAPGIFRRRVRRDVLFHLQASPQVQGRGVGQFPRERGVEIAWTVVPFIIVIAMGLPAPKVVVVAMKDTTNADLTIKATGYQWKWGYDYLKGEGEGHRLPVHARHGAARDVRCGKP